jgi:MurNAc alpha-1-phosphate uridylyltransferase
MEHIVAGVVLAAGLGRRLQPLTRSRPKALCPVGDVPLVDLALDRLAPVAAGPDAVAVNVHHHRAAMEGHLTARVHLSPEEGEPLGTAGALGHLRGWLDGRAALVVNADAWCPGSLAGFVDGWDGERVRVLVVGEDALGPQSAVAGALLPWSEVAALVAEPSGLWEASWRSAVAEDRLEPLRHDGPFVDCGTPARYLEANLRASDGASVVGAGALVAGRLERSVVWPGEEVGPDEVLVDAIRHDQGRTLLVRPSRRLRP